LFHVRGDYMRYRSRITLQSATTASWKGGCITTTWNTVNTYWANVSEEGKENYDNVKGQQNTILKIIMRSQITLDKEYNRFVFPGKNVHIESINDKTNKDNNIIVIGRIYE